MSLARILLLVTCGAFAQRTPEEGIPIIEIRGEGKPMTSAQIRHLEETGNGAPLDIKKEKLWIPPACQRSARRLDFITFHYKAFTEAGRQVDHDHGEDAVRIQLGVGMVMPGLDKGLKGMCAGEKRKIQIPYRLSRKSKSKMWKNIPNDEHWLIFEIEMLTVERWSQAKQFEFMGADLDSFLTESEILNFIVKMRKVYGKGWGNEDIDDVAAAKYFITYFDGNKDGRVDFGEFTYVMHRDRRMAKKEGIRHGRRLEGRLRDPGVAWILDFNNDGIVSVEEMNVADEILERPPALLPEPIIKEEL